MLHFTFPKAPAIARRAVLQARLDSLPKAAASAKPRKPVHPFLDRRMRCQELTPYEELQSDIRFLNHLINA